MTRIVVGVNGERPIEDDLTPRQLFLASYEPPETTGDAFNFGHRSALAGHGRLSMGEFFGDYYDHHPYPKSLWNAYKAGLKRGRAERKEKQKAWQQQHLEDLRAGRAVSLSGKDHTQEATERTTT